MKKLFALALILALAGCGTTADYKEYITAQTEANKQAVADAKPLFKLTAIAGQAITGLGSIEVNMPTAAPVFQQARPNEWAAVASQGLSVFGAVGGVIAGGRAAVGLADSVGRAGTAGYKYVQAPAAAAVVLPQANVTTTTTTTTTDRHDSVTTAAAAVIPQANVTTTTIGGSGVIGSGSYAAPSTAGSYNPATTTDNSNQGNTQLAAPVAPAVTK